MRRLSYLIVLLLVALSATGQGLSSNITSCFKPEPIPAAVQTRITGKSWRANSDIQLADLRYLRVMYVDFDDREHMGELICNAAIADDLADIFRELYRARYPLASVKLIDDFGADDERSMTANNTSCFCYRKIAGSRRVSKHALGRAIDINPLLNPCVHLRGDTIVKVEPAAGRQYANRKRQFRGKIAQGDLCLRLFQQHGFKWGGTWRTKPDYQHFEK